MLIDSKPNHGSSNTLMSQQALACFDRLANLASKTCTSNIERLSIKLMKQCRKIQYINYITPDLGKSRPQLARFIFYKEFPKISELESVVVQIALISKLAKNAPNLVAKENLPDNILKYYPGAFDRLALRLEKVANSPKQTRYNLFDLLGFVLATDIPCGAQLLDVKSTVPLQSVLLNIHRERSIKNLTNYIRCKGLGTWFRGHTDVEYLDEFNEEGWDRFYLSIAELLLRRKEVRGLVGTSWFYDPQLINISPRLAYLQLRQIERGAFLMRHRGLDSDINFATKTSPTRRSLYQEGKYNPISYSLVWERNKIISWANRLLKK